MQDRHTHFLYIAIGSFRRKDGLYEHSNKWYKGERYNNCTCLTIRMKHLPDELQKKHVQ